MTSFSARCIKGSGPFRRGELAKGTRGEREWKGEMATHNQTSASQARIPLRRGPPGEIPPAKRSRGGGIRRDSSQTVPETEDLKKTVFFLCGRIPWKAVLQIPEMSIIPLSVVRQASEDQEQSQSLLPTFPLGDFRVVYNDSMVQIAIFRHMNAFECSSTSSVAHGQLPFPRRTHKELASFLPDPGLRVGYDFLYGSSFDYTVDEEGLISYFLD